MTDTAPPLRDDAYERTYLLLAAVFIAALVACNLIFQKFLELQIRCRVARSTPFSSPWDCSRIR